MQKQTDSLLKWGMLPEILHPGGGVHIHETMRLAVIIINWNNAKDTISCAKTIQSWSRLNPTLLIVDNASHDGSPDRIMKEVPGAEIIYSPENLGFSGGNNLGFKRAISQHHEYIFILNNDAAIPEAHVSLLLESLTQHPEIGIVGPVIQETHENKTYYSLGGKDIALHERTRETALKIPEYINPLSTVDYVPGTAALMRSALIETLDGFDESYFFSGEMADFCRRAADIGYTNVIDRRAVAVHNMNHSGALRNRLYAYYSMRNRFLYIRKHGTRRQTWRWSGALFYRCVQQIVHRHFLDARVTALAILDGLIGRYGSQNERIMR